MQRIPQVRSLAFLALIALLLVSFSGYTPVTADPARPTDGPPKGQPSHRLIVELASAPLVTAPQITTQQTPSTNGRNRLNINTPAAQTYLAQLRAEQDAFIQQLTRTVPSARVDSFIDERGAARPSRYQLVFNGMTIDPGAADLEQTRRTLMAMPGVLNVYRDFPHATTLYTSTTLIGAPSAWDNAAIGGAAQAGAGIKVASMDGGVHKDAPMFSGTGYSYPSDFPAGGLGLTANNNGKIIASRAYFRSWDPPAAGDENPWPGENGTSHGVHTASTAAGNGVTGDYSGVEVELSGVAPRAWVMSYRVFYASERNDGSFYTAEGIAALEDIVRDGADVVNNSWGGGPSSMGGEFDPLDTALRNASAAGVFVAMSAGNAGPGGGTGDHPSDDYINVAATTSGGTFAAGRFSISAPAPVPADHKNFPYASASFGAQLPVGQVFSYPIVSAGAIDPANETGCEPWPANSFTGKAVAISRGVCEFGVKVLNAEQAGATFVVVYNTAAGGDELINMGPGEVGDQATIASIFIGRSSGLKLIAWNDTHGATAQVELNTQVYQLGNKPDYLASFSSRGPGVGNTLKPDIAAPGVNVVAQGYTPGATGEARHLGYGQVSGTSMAAPHVAGAAALLRQAYPTWSNAQIKSALMSTAKYLEVYNHDGSPAQPLDMGAGRLQVAKALDPGVLLDPPSLSYGLVMTGTTRALTVQLTSVASVSETYTISTLYTGNGFTQTTTLPGFTVTPGSITLAPGETKSITVRFNPATGQGLGDNQGYIVLKGTKYDAHMPAWARVVRNGYLADVLLIDHDFSEFLSPDYRPYYTAALDQLGLSYNVHNSADEEGLPSITDMLAYRAVVLFTGDNFYASTMTVPEQNRLTEYLNNGGTLIGMGQDLSDVLEDNFLRYFNFSVEPNLDRDGVAGVGVVPTLPLVATSAAPPALQDAMVSVAAPTFFSGQINLTSAEVVPVNGIQPAAAANTISGTLELDYNHASRVLDLDVELKATLPVSLTALHIRSGVAGENGDLEVAVFAPQASVAITPALAFEQSFEVLLSPDQAAALLDDKLYFEVLTEQQPAGAARGQMLVVAEEDGAGNQGYIDELLVEDQEYSQVTPLLHYFGSTVAVAHRSQLSLERPGVAYPGRAIFAAFGLEGVNNLPDSDMLSREQILGAFLTWGINQTTASVNVTSPASATSRQVSFAAEYGSSAPDIGPVAYRWDFGDGSPYVASTIPQATHLYALCGSYTVRVEITDSLGNTTLGVDQVQVNSNCSSRIYLPLIGR